MYSTTYQIHSRSLITIFKESLRYLDNRINLFPTIEYICKRDQSSQWEMYKRFVHLLNVMKILYQSECFYTSND